MFNKQQTRSIMLLSMGTFLEYFDLMLYVHMAVILNDIFFPKVSPEAASLLNAFAFSTTFVFRPVGAIVFGYIGDKYGRKTVIIITATLMSLSCMSMAILPSYAQIGVYASILVTVLRAMQGISSMGEVIAADLYLTETIKIPARYRAVGIITLFSVIGGNTALGIAALSTSYGFNWRIAFWFGATIAIIGAVARRHLQETKEFLDPVNRIERSIISAHEANEIKKAAYDLQKTMVQKINKVSLLWLLCMDYAWPACMYLVYFYCASLLKSKFDYTSAQVLHHNFTMSLFHITKTGLIAYLVGIVDPLKIVMIRALGFIAMLFCIPFFDDILVSPMSIMMLQIYILTFSIDAAPALPVMYRHFPVFKRFTYVGLSFACSRAFAYVVTSFGIAYLVSVIGQTSGLLVIFVPATVLLIGGTLYFQKLDKEIPQE